MELALFYYTLLMFLLSIMVSAVCMSAYLVSHKRSMLLLSIAFAFYFFDIALVFQDEFIMRSTGETLSATYILIRSLASVVTGGGFITAFWLLVCDYLDKVKRTTVIAPPIAFAVVSVAMLFLPEGETQRFWFWTIHQFYMYFILIYAGWRFFRTKDQTERARLWRHRLIYIVAWVLSIGILVEDAVFFLILDLPSFNLGPLVFTTERNYAENLLLLVIGVATVRACFRTLSLRFEHPPAQGGSKQQEQQIVENLNVFATRHKLSQREREVLYLILLGKDNQNIASEMSLALSTVKVHVHNILKKTGDASRQELIQDFWKMS